MRPTAIGVYIGLVVAPDGHTWMCVLFDKLGHWKSYGLHATIEEARAKRRELRKWHKKLAQIRHKRRG